jgi:hypothetical protein
MYSAHYTKKPTMVKSSEKEKGIVHRKDGWHGRADQSRDEIYELHPALLPASWLRTTNERTTVLELLSDDWASSRAIFEFVRISVVHTHTD